MDKLRTNLLFRFDFSLFSVEAKNSRDKYFGSVSKKKCGEILFGIITEGCQFSQSTRISFFGDLLCGHLCYQYCHRKCQLQKLNLRPEINNHISVPGEQSVRRMLSKHLSDTAFCCSSLLLKTHYIDIQFLF